MAAFIPVGKPMESKIATPLTLSAFQTYVGGFVKFIELTNGDYMVVNEAAVEGIAVLNETATSLAGRAGPIYGNAVLVDPGEIA